MGKKKNRVIATATVHLTENGTYKVTMTRGTERKDMCDLDWRHVEVALREMREHRIEKRPILLLASENGAPHERAWHIDGKLYALVLEPVGGDYVLKFKISS